MTDIPVVDVSALYSRGTAGTTHAADELTRAFSEFGFACVTGTRVDSALPEGLRRVLPTLFALPAQEKQRLGITRDNYRGFIPLGFFSPNDGGTADHYEAYKLHTEIGADHPVCHASPLYGPNRWPAAVPALKQLTAEYWQQLDALHSALLSALCQTLSLPMNFVFDAFRLPLTNMTLLHYPKTDQPVTGIHPHKDTNVLTIIAADPTETDAGGLEVRHRNGEWLRARCPDDGFIVNIGDMLELWSGGNLVSTPHRVIAQPDYERYSFPWFSVPRHDVIVDSLIEPVAGFARAPVHCGHWSKEVWRTNWPDEVRVDDGLSLGAVEH